MGQLKYAILGLVNRRAMSGYDIAKNFDGALSKFWEARHSQIYPELQRLMEEGLVTYDVELSGEKLEKKMYSITPEGESELRRWITTPSPLEPTPKDAFRLKLYFGENLSREETGLLLRACLAEHEARLEELERRIKELTPDAPLFTDDFSEHILARGGILRERAYVQWLRECAGLLGLADEI